MGSEVKLILYSVRYAVSYSGGRGRGEMGGGKRDPQCKEMQTLEITHEDSSHAEQ